ncbi:MAG: DUF1959 domain-containing protein [archaeon]|nr:DUF1959 domain-containing protein [archaeon]
MNSDEKLKLLKQRVLHSFKWEEIISHPFAEEFGVSVEEFEDILMNHLDMSELENLLSTLETANHDKILRQLDLDLRIYWLGDVLKIISPKEYNPIKEKLAEDIKNGRDYEECLQEGRDEIISILKNH